MFQAISKKEVSNMGAMKSGLFGAFFDLNIQKSLLLQKCILHQLTVIVDEIHSLLRIVSSFDFHKGHSASFWRLEVRFRAFFTSELVSALILLQRIGKRSVGLICAFQIREW